MDKFCKDNKADMASYTAAMPIFKKYRSKVFSYIAFPNGTVSNLQKITTSTLLIVFLLIAFLSEVVVARKLIQATGMETRDEICGTVHTTMGDTVTLRENETLSSEEFEKIHVKKLQNATFQAEKRCSIQVCGFTSYGKRINENYIGSDNDYADCLQFREKTIADHDIFNELYNLSSISCGCYKEEQQCMNTCKTRAESLNKTWKEDDCAMLYQEHDCNACYLNSIQLSSYHTYTTDNSHHVLSMVVKDKCEVHLFIPVLKKMYRFANISLPIVFESGPTENQVSSGFQDEPQYFECACDVHPRPPPTPYPPHKDSYVIFATVGYVMGGVSTLSVVIIICVGVGMWRSGRWRVVKKGAVKLAHGSTTTVMTEVTEGESQDMDYDIDVEVRVVVVSEDEGEESGEEDQITNVPFNAAFETTLELFEIQENLGTGHFGQVCKGTLTAAIKTVKDVVDLEERRMCIKSLQQEIKILSYLGSHENVVRLLGVHVGDYVKGELYLIIEYCEKGSLESYLASTVKPRIQSILCERALERMGQKTDEDGYAEKIPGVGLIESNNLEIDDENDLETLDPEILRLFYQWCSQIACGMMYIQSKNIVHVDLAARNVLLTFNLVAKIGDFGLAKKVYIKNYASSKRDSLPIRWVAPESLTKKRCTSKSDVWSFGVTAWEIFNLGKIPYDDLDCAQVVASIIKGERLECPQYASEDVFSILLNCWKECPEERPSFVNLEKEFDLKMSLVRGTHEEPIYSNV